ncbi:MAG: SDR family NAD(P)-dependent oxidoreductase, partial [Acetobacteraceae bacterium]|nr:SDR family NAD(P)-dependent oxidoreductase [Acetobacteraceae bacterium]
TGATSGFGQAIARRFVREGHRVVATGRRGERLQALGGELGASLLAFPLDITDAPSIASLPGTLPQGWREIDVLVNNAGLGLGLSPAHETRLQDWDTMLATNVAGLMRITHALLPGMVARDRGHVVNISSTAARYPYPGGNVYGATKAFVTQFSLNLKADLVGTGVRVTDLEPGLVGGSEFSQVRFGGDAAKAAAVYAGTTPLTPEDIAEAVAWVVNLPAHVNINRLEMMPTCQAPGPLAIKRRG